MTGPKDVLKVRAAPRHSAGFVACIHAWRTNARGKRNEAQNIRNIDQPRILAHRLTQFTNPAARTVLKLVGGC